MDDQDDPIRQPGRDSDDLTALWLRQLRAGDGDAANRLCDRYFGPLADSFHRWFKGRPHPVLDEEDLTVDVIYRVLRRIQTSPGHEAMAGIDLWRILRRSGRRRLTQQHRHEHRRKRDVARTLSSGESQLERVPDGQPSPERLA